MVKPKMRSTLSPTSAFMMPCFSPVAAPAAPCSSGAWRPRRFLDLPLRLRSSDVRERRIGEHAVRNQPIPSASPPSSQIVASYAKVVFGYVGEHRAAGAFAERPDVRRARTQPLVDANETAAVQAANAGLGEADPGRVRHAARRDQDVAALNGLLAGARANVEADPLSGLAAHTEKLGRDESPDAFVAKDPPHLLRDVEILPSHELTPELDDRHVAAETAVGLRESRPASPPPITIRCAGKSEAPENLDMGQRSRGLEAGNLPRAFRGRETPGRRQRARPSVVQAHLRAFSARQSARSP